MYWKLLLIFFMIMYAEITIFIYIMYVIGIVLTLILTLIISLIGIILVRINGMYILRQIQQYMFNNKNLTNKIDINIILLLVGFFLLIPGFLTDFIALLLIVPTIQNYLVIHLIPYLRFKYFENINKNNNIIEGEYTNLKDYKDK